MKKKTISSRHVLQGCFDIDVSITTFYNLLHRDHTHSALPPQTTAATMTTFEAIQTAAAARSASSNGFSMMSASEVAKRDMIKKITAAAASTTTTTGPETNRETFGFGPLLITVLFQIRT